VPPPIEPEKTLNATQWGMISFLISEVAFFGTLITIYAIYMGKDVSGPTPREVLKLGPLVIFSTLFLLSSSGTIHMAEKALHSGAHGGFLRWWFATIALGATFLLGTAIEWKEFITEHHLTISRNLFGTTYYTLVGFHAVHVTVGVIIMTILFGLALRHQVSAKNPLGVQLVSWYWHFVDVVWIVVFTLVYVISAHLITPASPEAGVRSPESGSSSQYSVLGTPGSNP
jgi:cytochrome c oxidase subunit 3